MSAEKNLFNWTLPITSRERLVLQPVILDTSEHAPASLLAGYSESPPKPQHVFYISMLSYPIVASRNKNIVRRKLKFWAEPRLKKIHI